MRTGTAKAGWLLVLFALLVAGVGAMDLATVTGLQRSSIEFDDAGGSTRILLAEGSIAGQSCEALTAVSGVSAAGSLRAATPITISAAPDNPLTSYAVSPQFATVIGVDSIGSGVWLTRELAATLAVSAGDVLDTDRGRMRIAGVYAYPEDGRDARLTYAVLTPESADRAFDECWARGWPGPVGFEDLLRWSPSVALGSSAPLLVGHLNNAVGPAYDPHAVFVERPTRWVPVGVAAMGGLLGWGSVRRRRLELASARHSGQRRTDQVAVMVIELFAWVLAGAVVALAIMGTYAAAESPVGSGSALMTQLPMVIVAILSALSGALVALFSVQERHLFAYFKER